MKRTFLGLQAYLQSLAHEVFYIINTILQFIFISSLLVKNFAYFNPLGDAEAILTFEKIHRSKDHRKVGLLTTSFLLATLQIFHNIFNPFGLMYLNELLTIILQSSHL